MTGRQTASVIHAAGRTVRIRGDEVTVDGVLVSLSGAPLAVLRGLAEQPGNVVPRARLVTSLPSGAAASEHAVEMAVARLRGVIGRSLVQTVVKRGYRLRVES